MEIKKNFFYFIIIFLIVFYCIDNLINNRIKIKTSNKENYQTIPSATKIPIVDNSNKALAVLCSEKDGLFNLDNSELCKQVMTQNIVITYRDYTSPENIVPNRFQLPCVKEGSVTEWNNQNDDISYCTKQSDGKYYKTQNRFLTSTVNSNIPVCDSYLTKITECPTIKDCVVSDWDKQTDDISYCTRQSDGKYYKTQTRTVISQAQNGGDSCQTLSRVVECTTIKDCILDWTNKIDTMEACTIRDIPKGKYSKIQKHFILQQPQNGGQVCPSFQPDRIVNCDTIQDCILGWINTGPSSLEQGVSWIGSVPSVNSSDLIPRQEGICRKINFGYDYYKVKGQYVYQPRGINGGIECPVKEPDVITKCDTVFDCKYDYDRQNDSSEWCISPFANFGGKNNIQYDGKYTKTRNRILVTDAQKGGITCDKISVPAPVITETCPTFQDCIYTTNIPTENDSNCVLDTTNNKYYKTITNTIIKPRGINGGESCPPVSQKVECSADFNDYKNGNYLVAFFDNLNYDNVYTIPIPTNLTSINAVNIQSILYTKTVPGRQLPYKPIVRINPLYNFYGTLFPTNKIVLLENTNDWNAWLTSKANMAGVVVNSYIIQKNNVNNDCIYSDWITPVESLETCILNTTDNKYYKTKTRSIIANSTMNGIACNTNLLQEKLVCSVFNSKLIYKNDIILSFYINSSLLNPLTITGDELFYYGKAPNDFIWGSYFSSCSKILSTYNNTFCITNKPILVVSNGWIITVKITINIYNSAGNLSNTYILNDIILENTNNIFNLLINKFSNSSEIYTNTSNNIFNLIFNITKVLKNNIQLYP